MIVDNLFDLLKGIFYGATYIAILIIIKLIFVKV